MYELGVVLNAVAEEHGLTENETQDLYNRLEGVVLAFLAELEN